MQDERFLKLKAHLNSALEKSGQLEDKCQDLQRELIAALRRIDIQKLTPQEISTLDEIKPKDVTDFLSSVTFLGEEKKISIKDDVRIAIEQANYLSQQCDKWESRFFKLFDKFTDEPQY
jgi:hypothetical protein